MVNFLHEVPTPPCPIFESFCLGEPIGAVPFRLSVSNRLTELRYLPLFSPCLVVDLGVVNGAS